MRRMIGGRGGAHRGKSQPLTCTAEMRTARQACRARGSPVAAAPATGAAAAAPPAAASGAGGGGAAPPAYPQAGQSPQPVRGAASSMGGHMLPGVA